MYFDSLDSSAQFGSCTKNYAFIFIFYGSILGQNRPKCIMKLQTTWSYEQVFADKITTIFYGVHGVEFYSGSHTFFRSSTFRSMCTFVCVCVSVGNIMHPVCPSELYLTLLSSSWSFVTFSGANASLPRKARCPVSHFQHQHSVYTLTSHLITQPWAQWDQHRDQARSYTRCPGGL